MFGWIKRYRLYREAYHALDNEAVTTWTLNSNLTQREQLHAVIQWHVDVALDPAVNGGYELIKTDSLLRKSAEVRNEQ